MPPQPDSSSAALIKHILSEFHEGHRRDLPALINLARQLPATGAAPSFADELQALMLDLEAHMFKEEMRLFPMMEQGGNTLIGLLIGDMEQEHARHSQHTPQMTARLAALQVPPDHQATLNALRTGWQAFLAELAQHVAAEDNGLFLMFKTPVTDV
ncbi:hemerythrin domain-containing protein [Rhodoferax sp. BLA1]|uniref:hemerythrin domain-containing protein n=1 Tax=Rhodoferax sp. BLA1 TaxID=2576062 RepID=UPI0015D2F7B6|nr:hemerythrin domain-containing protein [Rhodoferax sp. BLA1]